MADVTWVGESNGEAVGSRKRKSRPKRYEYIGWGSRQLIEFLEFRGKDTTNKISQFEASESVTRYIAEEGLLHPSNKKKVVCDDKLYLLFGKQSISKNKVYDLLEKHYEENQDDPEFDFLYDDETPKIISHSERPKKKVVLKPRGIYPAIVSDNIKLLYVRKSLAEELVKSPDTFESKLLGSFVRIKSDPNDYLQKYPNQLVQVTGVKKAQGTDDFLLQVTNYVKDVSISMLSDDNFSQEECEDLHQRMNNGFPKKPTIVEMEEKVRSLHEDLTKHWLKREIDLLQRLIDRANEKGWRKEMFDYLERMERLLKKEEQSRLLSEVPEIIEEEIVPNPEASPEVFPEASPEADKDDNEPQLSESPLSSVQQTPIHNLFGGEDRPCKYFPISNPSTTPGIMSDAMELNGRLPILTASAGEGYLHGGEEQPANGVVGGETSTKEPEVPQAQSSIPVIDLSNNGSQPQPNPSEIIELSDDDDEDDKGDGETLDPTRVEDDTETLKWFYKDPEGHTQGPFSVSQLKLWCYADYFPSDFKVWMTGQTPGSAVLLTDVLRPIC